MGAPIFISYKRVDKAKVFPLRDMIINRTGIDCWIDLEGIESDAQFASVIIRAIKECEVFIFMYSRSHAAITDYENDWTIRELRFAHRQKKRIVFINLDGQELTEWFDFYYGDKQQVDATDNSRLEKLTEDLRHWLKSTYTAPLQQPTPPTPPAPPTPPTPLPQAQQTPEAGIFDVILQNPGPLKLAALKLTKELTGLGLKEAKELVDNTPCVILREISSQQAVAIREQFAELEADVIIAISTVSNNRTENAQPYAVRLDLCGYNKLSVVKVVKETTGLGLKEAKELVDYAPSIIITGVTKSAACYIKEQLENVGAKASINPI